MSQAPVMPVFTDALIGDTTRLSTEEFGAYFLILVATWRNNGQPFADDDHDLAHICRMTEARWRTRIRPRIIAFFDVSEGFLRQKRLESEWNRTIEKITTNRENGSRGGRPKTLKNNDTPEANGSISQNRTANRKRTQTEPIHEPYPDLRDSPPDGADAPSGTPPPNDPAKPLPDRSEPPREVESAREVAERMVAIWRADMRAAGLRLPSKLTPDRVRAAAARWHDTFGGDEAEWRAYLSRIRASPFLLGGKGWSADFDWALRPRSILGVIEGKYDATENRDCGNGQRRRSPVETLYLGAMLAADALDRRDAERAAREGAVDRPVALTLLDGGRPARG